MSKYLLEGDSVVVYGDNDIKIESSLQMGAVYSVAFSNTKGFYLRNEESFDIVDVEGVDDIPSRIITKFKKSKKSLGVLLSGVQGSGKSRIAKKISHMLAKDFPTIVVNEGFVGQDFISFIGKLTPSVILFDEFEKTYELRDQESLLTLFDGGVSSSHLFLFTANNTYAISEFMLNRPSRIHYHFKFVGLSESAVKDYCLSNLKDKSYVDSIVRVAQFSKEFSFDLLRSIIEEANLFGGDLQSILDILNYDPKTVSSFEAIVFDNKNKKVRLNRHGYIHSGIDPFDLSETIYLHEDEADDLELKSDNFIKFKNNKYYYSVPSKDGWVIVLQEVASSVGWRGAL